MFNILKYKQLFESSTPSTFIPYEVYKEFRKQFDQFTASYKCAEFLKKAMLGKYVEFDCTGIVNGGNNVAYGAHRINGVVEKMEDVDHVTHIWLRGSTSKHTLNITKPVIVDENKTKEINDKRERMFKAMVNVDPYGEEDWDVNESVDKSRLLKTLKHSIITYYNREDCENIARTLHDLDFSVYDYYHVGDDWSGWSGFVFKSNGDGGFFVQSKRDNDKKIITYKGLLDLIENKEKPRVFNEMDPYGEEDWDVNEDIDISRFYKKERSLIDGNEYYFLNLKNMCGDYYYYLLEEKGADELKKDIEKLLLGKDIKFITDDLRQIRVTVDSIDLKREYNILWEFVVYINGVKAFLPRLVQVIGERVYTADDPYGEEVWEAKKSTDVELRGIDGKEPTDSNHCVSVLMDQTMNEEKRQHIIDLINWNCIGKKLLFINDKNGQNIKKERYIKGAYWKENHNNNVWARWELYVIGRDKDYHVNIGWGRVIGYYEEKGKIIQPKDKPRVKWYDKGKFSEWEDSKDGVWESVENDEIKFEDLTFLTWWGPYPDKNGDIERCDVYIRYNDEFLYNGYDQRIFAGLCRAMTEKELNDYIYNNKKSISIYEPGIGGWKEVYYDDIVKIFDDRGKYKKIKNPDDPYGEEDWGWEKIEENNNFVDNIRDYVIGYNNKDEMMSIVEKLYSIGERTWRTAESLSKSKKLIGFFYFHNGDQAWCRTLIEDGYMIKERNKLTYQEFIELLTNKKFIKLKNKEIDPYDEEDWGWKETEGLKKYKDFAKLNEKEEPLPFYEGDRVIVTKKKSKYYNQTGTITYLDYVDSSNPMSSSAEVTLDYTISGCSKTVPIRLWDLEKIDPVRKITKEDPYGEEDWGDTYESFLIKDKEHPLVNRKKIVAELNDMLSGKLVKFYTTLGQKRELIKKVTCSGFFNKDFEYYFHTSNKMGDYYIVDANRPITILPDPIITADDPYGEEDWNESKINEIFDTEKTYPYALFTKRSWMKPFVDHVYKFTSKDNVTYYVTLSLNTDLGRASVKFTDEANYKGIMNKIKDKYVNLENFDAINVLNTVFKISKDYYNQNKDKIKEVTTNTLDPKRLNIYKYLFGKYFPDWKMSSYTDNRGEFVIECKPVKK